MNQDEQEVKAAMDLRYRGEAMIGILRDTIRLEGQQEYKLDLGEMYLLLDYTSHLRECIENQKHTIAELQRCKPLELSDLVERVSDSTTGV